MPELRAGRLRISTYKEGAVRTLLVSLLFSAATLSAAEVTGKWPGTMEVKSPEREPRTERVYRILKQDGEKLEGSGGPQEGEQHPMQNGKVEGDRLTFQIQLSRMTLSFDLRAKDDQIEGDIKGERTDGRTETAQLSLKRVADK